MIDNVWGRMIEAARQRILKTLGWSSERDPVDQIAEEIVAGGEAEKFLKAARKGRPERRISLRTQIVRAVERMQAVKKRKPRRTEKADGGQLTADL